MVRDSLGPWEKTDSIIELTDLTFTEHYTECITCNISVQHLEFLFYLFDGFDAFAFTYFKGVNVALLLKSCLSKQFKKFQYL